MFSNQVFAAIFYYERSMFHYHASETKQQSKQWTPRAHRLRWMPRRCHWQTRSWLQFLGYKQHNPRWFPSKEQDDQQNIINADYLSHFNNDFKKKLSNLKKKKSLFMNTTKLLPKLIYSQDSSLMNDPRI